jgi:hypothetical protein
VNPLVASIVTVNNWPQTVVGEVLVEVVRVTCACSDCMLKKQTTIKQEIFKTVNWKLSILRCKKLIMSWSE